MAPTSFLSGCWKSDIGTGYNCFRNHFCWSDFGDRYLRSITEVYKVYILHSCEAIFTLNRMPPMSLSRVAFFWGQIIYFPLRFTEAHCPRNFQVTAETCCCWLLLAYLTESHKYRVNKVTRKETYVFFFFLFSTNSLNFAIAKPCVTLYSW